MYTLDSLGRVLAEWRQSGADTIGRAYIYDGFGRLLKVQRATFNGCTVTTDSITGAMYSCSTVTPLPTKDSVGYDVAGNRTLPGATYSATGNRLLTWPGPLGTITLAYDADGNVISRTYNGSTDSLFWGANNMLDSEHVTGGLRYTFDYNSFGQPIRLSVNGNVTSWWLWNGSQLIAELDSTGTYRRSQYLYHGGMDQAYAIVTDSGGSPLVRYLQQDALGNITGVVRGTSLVQYTQYTPWGDIGAQSINAMPDTNRLGWQGLPHAGDNAPFYFMRNRLYDAQIGRFLNEDPIGLAGGMNLYSFAGDDPINERDPLGLCPAAANGDLCVDFYISASKAWIFRGDGRGSNPNASFSQSRMQVVIEPSSNMYYYKVSPSCYYLGSDMTCYPPMSSNQVYASITRGATYWYMNWSPMFGGWWTGGWFTPTTIHVSFSVTNSAATLGMTFLNGLAKSIGAITGDIFFYSHPDGVFTTSGNVTGFPSMDIYEMENGRWTPLNGSGYHETTPFDLFLGGQHHIWNDYTMWW
jgi:RHS repeat-associated protein